MVSALSFQVRRARLTHQEWTGRVPGSLKEASKKIVIKKKKEASGRNRARSTQGRVL